MSWRIGLSSGSWAASPPADVLPILTGSGARGFELGTPLGYADSWRGAQVEVLGRSLADASLDVVSIHAPFGGPLDLADPDPDHRHRAVAAMLGAANAVKRMGGHLVVVHPTDLERHGSDVGARLADAARGLAFLADHCRNVGLTLAIETPLPHLIGGHPDEFAWLLEHTDASARVCLDTGHTTLGRSWHKFLAVADGRLAHVHASDNHGVRDDHLPPGDGTIDWAEITRTLQAVDYSGWIMLELHPEPAGTSEYVKRACERAAALLAHHAVEGGR
jgi:sugar phosphate isomerase/epimerase